jgi:hypothetical protein
MSAYIDSGLEPAETFGPVYEIPPTLVGETTTTPTGDDPAPGTGSKYWGYYYSVTLGRVVLDRRVRKDVATTRDRDRR